MGNYKDCVDGILKAAKGAMKESDAFATLAQIEETLQAAKANGYGIDKALFSEGDAKTLMKIEKTYLYKKLNTIESRIKLNSNIQAIRESVAKGNNIKAAVEFHGQKVKANIEQRVTTLNAKLLKHLEEEGVSDFFLNRKEADKVALYKSQLIDIDPATGKPLVRSGGLDVSKIPEADMMAYRTAKAMAKMDDFYHTMQNKLGAPVGFLQGRIGKNNFNAALITLNKESRDGFMQDMLSMTDWSKVYIGKLSPTEFIQMLTDKIASGVHGKLVDFDEILNEAYTDIAGAAGSRGSNLAEKLGKYRTLHIKPEHWNEFNTKWGSGDVYDSTLNDISAKARQMELLQTYGANPANSFTSMIDKLQRATADLGVGGKHPLDDRNIKEGLLKVILGTDQSPANGQWARIFQSLRLHESATHLGNLLFSSLSDVTNAPMYTVSKLAHQSIGQQVQGFGEEFATQMQARAGMLSNPLKTALYKGQVAGLDTFSSMMKSGRPLRDVLTEAPVQTVGQPLLNKTLDKIDGFNNFMFRINPGKTWTDAGLQAQMNSLAYTFGDLATHAKTDGMVQKWFNELGIADYWDVLKTKVYTDTNGKKFIHVDALDDITDAEVRAIKGQELTARQLSNARDEILTNFKSTYMQHAKAALSMPGVGLEAQLALMPKGTFWGEVSRMTLQFKSFPYEYMTKTIYPIWKNQKGLFAAGVTSTTGVVLLSNYLKDLAAGKTIRDYWGTSGDTDAVYRNWVALSTSVIGFPVLDEIVKRMLSEEGFKAKDTATMLGPIVGDAGSTLENISKAIKGLQEGNGDKVAESAIKTVKGAPVIGPILQGHIFKGAVERVFLDNINTMFNPNYMESKEKIAELQGSRIIGQ
jgi:hypothetical protein